MGEIVLTNYILQVLKEVYSNPGVKVSEISKKYNISYPALSRIIKSLRNKKLIIVKEEKKGEKKIKRLYPYYIACNSGIVILPYLEFKDNVITFVSLLIFNCPYYQSCSYKDKDKGLSEECQLLKSLPENIRNKILEYKKYIESLLGKSIDELIK